MRKSLLTAALGSASFLLLQSTALAAEAGPLNSAQTGETVIITASPFATDPLAASASVVQIPRTELLISGGFGLGDALKNVPGVTSSSFTAGAARPVIRGLDATRVRVTENGLGSHDVSDISGDHAVPIDPLASIEVEVLRGPATLRYGSQAIGGVVNAINNRIPLNIAQGTNVEAFGGISSNGLERLGGGTADYRDGNWAFHADGIIRGADDYDTPDGTQANTFAFGRGFAVGGAYVDNGSGAGIGFNQYIAHYGIASEPGGEVAHIDLDQKNYTGGARLMAPLPGITSINWQGGHSDYMHDEVVDGVGIASTFKNKEWENRIEVIHGGLGMITAGAVGLQFGNRDFEALGEALDYLLPTKTDSLGLYIFEDVALNELFSVQGAARAEWTDITGATNAFGAFDRQYQPLSFELGAVFRPTTETSFFVNFAATERAPSVTELLAQGPHEASATFDIGDPTLKKEKAVSFEGGFRILRPNGSTASISAYHTSFDGFVTGVFTGNSYDEDGNFFPDDSEEFAEQIFLQRDATFWGLEGQAHWHLFDVGKGRAGIDAQFDYVRATFDSGGNVPRIPPFRFGGGLFFESDDVALRFNIQRASAQSKTAAQETRTPGYTNVDVSAVFHVASGPNGDLDILLAASNLTGSRQRNHVSYTKDHVLFPGRTFRLMLHYTR